jgi:hypothetical protein
MLLRQVIQPLPRAPRQVTLPLPQKATPQATAITPMTKHESLQGNPKEKKIQNNRKIYNYW